MGIKRPVDVSFWTDGKVDDFSPEDKYFMLYLLTNPFSKQLGIYEISIKQAAFQMGYSVDAFNVLLERFENKYKIIVFSKETNEIAILNFLRYSVIKGGKPVEDCIRQDMINVKNKKLIDIVFSHICGREGLNKTVKEIVDAYIKEKGVQKENNNNNDNDNDNDRTGNESYDDSRHDSSKEPAKPKKSVKHKYGEFKNVLLTDDELAKLRDDFGSDQTIQAIDFLDVYIEEKGYKSKSHNLAIRRWVMDAIKERQKPQGARPVYQKHTKADELDDFYRMAAQFGESE